MRRFSARTSEQDLRAIVEGTAEAPERLWALLERTRRGWVLVLDNADDPELLASPVPSGGVAHSGSVADSTGWARPSSHGLVLVTSRVADPHMWGQTQADVHRLGMLSKDEAAAVLFDLVRHNRGGRRADRRWGIERPGNIPDGEESAARDLTARLGGLPLALHGSAQRIHTSNAVGSRHHYRTYVAAVPCVSGRQPACLGCQRPRRIRPASAVYQQVALSVTASE